MRAAILFAASVVVGCASSSLDPGAMAEGFDPPPAIDQAAVRRGADLAEAALAELEAGRAAEAADVARRALAEDPRNARARAVMAHGLMGRAMLDNPPTLALWRRAEGELRRASRIAPDDPVVARLHAVFLVSDGHLTAAAERVDAGLERVPGDPDLVALGSSIRFDLGDEEAAVLLLERRLELVGDDADATWRLAQCHARLAAAEIESAARVQRLDLAVEAFASYRRLAPDDVDGPLGEAQVRLSRWSDVRSPGGDEIEAVLALYETAARLLPESAEPVFGRAVALEMGGRAEEARQAYRAALALEPGHLPSMLNLGAALAAEGQREAARPLLERALELGVEDDERSRIEAWLREDGDEQREPPVTPPGSSSPSRRGSSGP